MQFSPLLFVASIVCIGVTLASPAINSTIAGEPHLSTRDYASPWNSGYSFGYYYVVWGSDTVLVNQGTGSISVNWTGSTGYGGGGIGWYTGTTSRVINYNMSYYQATGNSYMFAYGWTRNPLIEYSIVETYGTYNPASAAQRKGSVYCNGANYDILSTIRYNQPSIDGTQTYAQFWSVRNPKRNPGALTGQIDIACHHNAWRNVGMNLGISHFFQVIAVLGYYSGGSAKMTVY